ncbi:MAG: DUF4129 domain-containing protein [Clostridia bacterium]|nr:DUF4129 domain-containing protein [Clostridia bacterium]
MDPSVILKILADLCLYFGVAGLILPAGEALPALCIMGVVGAAQALLQERQVRPLFRALALTPLLGVLFFVRSGQLAFLILPPTVYVAVLCYTGRVALSREQFLGYFRPIILFLAAALLLLLLFAREGKAMANALPFAAAGFLFGAMLLRTLRHVRTTRRHPRFIFINLGIPLLLTLLAFLLAKLGLAGALKDGFGFVYQSLIMPLLLGLSYVIFGVVFLFQKLLSLFESKESASAAQFEANLGALESELGVMAGESSELVGKILVAMGILFGLVLLYFLFRSMLGERLEKPIAEDAGSVSRTLSPDRPKERKKLLAPRTPEEQVRRYFKKILQLSREAGITYLRSDTSERAAKRASAVFDPKGMEELRSLYIRARYSPKGVSREEVRQARGIYEALKKARKQEAGDSGRKYRGRTRTSAALRHKTMG